MGKAFDRLKENINFWRHLGTNDFMIDLTRNVCNIPQVLNLFTVASNKMGKFKLVLDCREIND